MMMIINKNPQFFWTTIQKNFSLQITKISLLLLLGILTLISCSKNENLRIQSLKTNTGWGYSIINKEKTIIKQTMIPVISEIKSFETEDDALKVGNLVLQKLKADLSPTITKKDLILLDIKI
jgi:hypothetical protein|nr:DUF4907 domain-containing protein [uncultured Flavobacterium sp.]